VRFDGADVRRVLRDDSGDLRQYAGSVVRFDDVSETEQARCLTAGEATSTEKTVEARLVKATLDKAMEQLSARYPDDREAAIEPTVGTVVSMRSVPAGLLPPAAAVLTESVRSVAKRAR